jgi:cytochrome P450
MRRLDRRTEIAMNTKASIGPRIQQNPFFTSSPFEPTLPAIKNLDEIDLTDFDLYTHGDPHAAWRLLREQAPVFFNKGVARGYGDQPFWAVTTYEGVTKVLRDVKTFSQRGGSLLDVTPAVSGLEDTLVVQEGAVHRDYRKVVAPYTSRSTIVAAEASIHETVRKAIDVYTRTDTFDAAALAKSLPPEITCAFLKVSGDEAARFHRLYTWNDTYNAETAAERVAFEHETTEQLLNDRRKNPRDDIITALANDEDSGRLTHQQAVKFISLATSAAFAGLRAAVHNPILALLHHPEQFALLHDHPEYIEDGRAIEELLRWAGFSMHLARRAAVDTELLGQQIRAGEVVVVFHTSANRDENVFEDPYVLDLGRKRGPILTFGPSPHQCLGEFLTRATVKSLLLELTDRFETMEQAGPLVRTHLGTVIASIVSSLPVAVTRRRHVPVRARA